MLYGGAGLGQAFVDVRVAGGTFPARPAGAGAGHLVAGGRVGGVAGALAGTVRAVESSFTVYSLIEGLRLGKILRQCLKKS